MNADITDACGINNVGMLDLSDKFSARKYDESTTRIEYSNLDKNKIRLHQYSE